MSKKAIKICASLTIATTILASPYSINTNHLIGKSVSNAEETNFEEPLQTVTFISSENAIEEKVEEVVESKDPSVDQAQEVIEEESLTVNTIVAEGTKNEEEVIEESTSVAASIEDVNKDEVVKEYVQESLADGQTVYLYGEISNKDYVEALDMKEEELSVKVEGENGKEAELVFADDEGIELKTDAGAQEAAIENSEEDLVEAGQTDETSPVVENSLENDPDFISNHETEKLTAESDVDTAVIGYSLDENSEIQYTSVGVTSYDKEGNVIDVDESVYVQEILDNEATVVEYEKEELGINETTDTALIQKSTANAAKKFIHDNYDIRGSAYLGKKKVGTIQADYVLYKQTGDKSPKYDYFNARPAVSNAPKSGWKAVDMWLDFDIPSNSDNLTDWKPKGNMNRDSYTVTVGYPWEFSFSIGFDNNLNITDLSKKPSDFARWEVKRPFKGSITGEEFKGSVSWRSYGTLASASIQGKGTFKNKYDGYEIKATTKRHQIRYNY